MSVFFLYLPFGETMAQQNAAGWETPYKFTVKVVDADRSVSKIDPETGLYYFGARYYDPHISLWMSVDPLAEKYPGWSPYAYVFNNPLKFVDPDGMGPEDEWEITLNSKGFNTVKWISGKGGDKTDHIRITNGISIPRVGAVDYSYSVEVKHNVISSNNEISRGVIEKGPGYRVHDVGSNGALEDVDLSDFIPSKGAIKGGATFAISHLLKDIGEEEGEIFLKKEVKNIAKDLMKGGKKAVRDRDFRIKDKQFWKWWEKQKQSMPGTGRGKDIKDMGEAKRIYKQWKNDGN